MIRNHIINNKAAIFECAKAFRQDANFLMTELLKDFGYDVESNDVFSKEMYAHKYNNKGIFREDWTYYFHGAHCKFENLQTGQIVELRYTTKTEFGFLDGFFFYNYMLTTNRFKELAAWFLDYLNVYRAIEILEQEGVLVRITNDYIDGVIAL